jgi:hypothetical protein
VEFVVQLVLGQMPGLDAVPEFFLVVFPAEVLKFVVHAECHRGLSGIPDEDHAGGLEDADEAERGKWAGDLLGVPDEVEDGVPVGLRGLAPHVHGE